MAGHPKCVPSLIQPILAPEGVLSNYDEITPGPTPTSQPQACLSPLYKQPKRPAPASRKEKAREMERTTATTGTATETETRTDLVTLLPRRRMVLTEQTTTRACVSVAATRKRRHHTRGALAVRAEYIRGASFPCSSVQCSLGV